MKLHLAAGLSALALAAACGQSAQVTTPPPETPPPAAPAAVTISPQDFAQRVANSDAFEIQSSELAAARGARADVKQFAQMMVRDHRTTTQELSTLAPTIGLTAPTAALDAGQRANIATLEAASGEAFDDAYLDQQVAAHEAAVRLFQDFIAGAPEGPLKQWAQTTLPKLQQHLSSVQALENAT